MKHSSVRKFQIGALVALPLFALIAVAIAFTWGHSSSAPTQAAGTGSMALDVSTGDKTCADPLDTADFCVPTTGLFTVTVSSVTIPAAGYQLAQSWVQYGDVLDYKKPSGFPNDTTVVWPDCVTATIVGGQGDDVASPNGNDRVNNGCLTGLISFAKSNFIGVLFEYDFNCSTGDSTSTISLIPTGTAPAGTLGSQYQEFGTAKDVPTSDSITVHCQVAPTATPSQTPTQTFTPTPTNTPVSQPPFEKSPSEQNLWLTRQGTKIPPVQCVGPQGGDDAATLEMSLGVPIAQLDHKGSGKVVDLGAFEFEVNYDHKQVCVEITRAQASQTMTCFIEDSVTKPTLEGVARIGCVTVGKKIVVDGIWSMHLDAGIFSADCILLIQEAPLFGASVGIPAVKGALIATGPPGVDLDPVEDGEQNCTGATGVFGFVTVPVPPLGYNNQTGDLVAIIPCQADSMAAGLCTEDGSVIGTFTQDEVTLELVFNGTFNIQTGAAFGNLKLDGNIFGPRISRLALDLANVIVHPQPDVYSDTVAHQDNGHVVQLTNKNCELADQQGFPITHFSCGDADVTIRFLEGDVEPDCVVDVLDTQAIAFRWGSTKGSLIFNDRFNLEPFGTQSDNDIDIKDLQAVYGRLGSTCEEPHPPQPAINAKA